MVKKLGFFSVSKSNDLSLYL